MSVFEIQGGHKLSGSIVPQGAKNEALQVICATLLTADQVEIHNIPEILDVLRLIDILKGFGVKIDKTDNKGYSFQADEVDLNYLDSKEFFQKASALRGSVMTLGPILGRLGIGKSPKPGGDKIGRRRLDTHFIGFQQLGAKFSFDQDHRLYEFKADRLRGGSLLLDEASVTGTANLVMAAVLAEGRTELYNAACEPYIQQLCKMLVSMGANIQGIGSNLLIIDGVESLSGTSHVLLPDMIEVGSFIGMAAMTGSEITIKNVSLSDLGIIPEVFRKIGITVIQQGQDLLIPSHENYEVENFIDGSILTISDAPWPGFTPDLISVILVVATQANGTILVHQKMFESRLFFVDKLIDMGAQIILCDPHRATVIGLNRKVQLRGITMTSPDIRAGISLLITALSAKGTSKILNIDQIDRGYEDIDERLRALGAKIQRVEE